MFSDELAESRERFESIGCDPVIDRAITESLLEKAGSGDRLNDEELTALLNGLSDVENARAVREYARAYPRPNDDQVLLLPPLYFSSICENACAYCDFSSGDGQRLSLGAFQDEVQALLDHGYRSIELVSSQDPDLFLRKQDFDLNDQRFDVTPVARYFEILREGIEGNGGGMITSNIPPVCTDGFGVLREAGLDCFLAWLETFDPERYERMHVSAGPKGSQSFRLNSFDRARQAGIQHVAGAFLKGLADWRKEEAALYVLDRSLRARWGRGFSIVGTPRVKGRFAGTRMGTQHRMSDDQYELNIALDRILFDGVLWLQTRESFETNLRLIESYGGGVVLTLTSCTAPGGYSKPPSATEQFPVFKQDLDASVARLDSLGLTARFAWGPEDLIACSRSAAVPS